MLKYYLLAQDRVTLILNIVMPLFAAAMIVFHMYLTKRQKKNKVWRGLCFLPALLCLIHYSLYYFKGSLKLTLSLYGWMYLAAILIAIWQFFGKNKKIYRIAAAVTICAVTVLCFLNILLPTLSNPVVGNYSKENYVESFLGLTDEMKRHYCLNEWKEIDYDSIKEQILPEVEKAQQEKDAAGYLAALCKYTYYFHDSHVYAGIMKQEELPIVAEVKDRLAGNDYGFSMIACTDGGTAAVLVEDGSDAYAAGVRNGTKIISWDGVPVEEARENVECIYYYGNPAPALLENENKLKAAFLAGKGGDTVEVEFLDSDGKIKKAEIKKSGSYAARLDDFLNRFYYNSLDKDNFETEMVSDSHGYLRVKSEQYDTLCDIKAVFRDDYPEIQRLLEEKLAELKEQGMETLIIDARNNYGGYNVISAEIAALFTDTGGFNYSFGEYKNGEYILTDPHYYTAKGTWKDLPVVVLTNASCMSAGDQLIHLLAQCPNVTVVGTTCSSGVNQNNGGICLTTDSEFVVAYPFALTLNEEGVPNIDADKSRLNRVLIDEYIPIDDDYIQAVFGEESRDYELEYVLENY